MAKSITAEPGAVCDTAQEFRGRRGMWHRGRPLKRWRWIGVFGEHLMLCAADVHIGPARQTFWALHLRGELAGVGDRERTRLLPRRGELGLREGAADGSRPGLIRIRDRGVELELELYEEPGHRARCPNGRSESWTRKQAGIAVEGTLGLDGDAPRRIEASGAVDDSAGYHARETEWRWSTGVGTGTNGEALAWNLVEGINDPPRGSERAVWVDGVPHEVAPVSFARDLGSIRDTDGAELRFTAESERSRSDNMLLVSSDYRAPFGTFAGTLPGGIELVAGLGVVEHHRARW